MLRKTPGGKPNILSCMPWNSMKSHLKFPIESLRTHTHRIRMYGIYMLTWLGYIDGQWQTIYSIHTDPSWDMKPFFLSSNPESPHGQRHMAPLSCELHRHDGHQSEGSGMNQRGEVDDLVLEDIIMRYLNSSIAVGCCLGLYIYSYVYMFIQIYVCIYLYLSLYIYTYLYMIP